jgi:hypothetical protein
MGLCLAVANLAMLQCARAGVNAPATADHYPITDSGADAAWDGALATE